VKLNVKTVQRTAYKSPEEQRRAKLLAAIEEQMRVFEAALRGEEYTVITYKFFRTFDSCVGCFQFHGEEQ